MLPTLAKLLAIIPDRFEIHWLQFINLLAQAYAGWLQSFCRGLCPCFWAKLNVTLNNELSPS